MTEGTRDPVRLADLLAEALKVADQLGLDLVAIRIVEAIDLLDLSQHPKG